MKNGCLPGIKTVEYISSESLIVETPPVLREGSIVTVYGDFREILIVGLGACSVTSEIVSGQAVYTTKLTIVIRDEKEETRTLLEQLVSYPNCFRIRDVYKEAYLIGTGQRPHPTIISTYSNEDTPTGKRGYVIEITYVNTFSILQLS
ncbi:MAG: hypothetical protein LBQ39_06995 [Tannerellaceae bacterium]|jgi:hypothetical protein|nr:hypothetical protein [Tannerellaceae bacterium]